MEVFALRVHIRPFDPEDLEQVTRFWKEMWSDPVVAGDFCFPTEENVARWQRYIMKVHRNDRNQILVAKTNGKLVGYIFFLNRADFPLETRYAWAFVNGLYVRPAYRRKGIATELMKEAFDHLKSIGVAHVRLNVMISNRAATELYRKLGSRDYSLRMQAHLTDETT